VVDALSKVMPLAAQDESLNTMIAAPEASIAAPEAS
jgi:hypothetical protein